MTKNQSKRGGRNLDKGKEKIGADLLYEENVGCTQDSTATQSNKMSRGPTHMDSISRLRNKGIILKVEFNNRGQPIGENAVKMQSSLGQIVREKVPITYNTWKHVPIDIKERVWEAVNVNINDHTFILQI